MRLNEQWARLRQMPALRGIRIPLFHKTQEGNVARSILWSGLRARISGGQGYSPDALPGAGISFSRSFDWVESGDIPGDYVFVFDQRDFPRKMLRSFQDAGADDEFEERYYGSHVPADMIKAVIILRPLRDHERDAWQEAEVPVYEKNRGKWQEIHEDTMTDLEVYLEGLRGNLDEAKAKTYATAKLDIWDELYQRGWKMSNFNLKVPHASHPHDDYRLWFKKQAIWSGGANPPNNTMGSASSMHVDIRKVDPKRFADYAEKQAEKTRARPNPRYDW